MHLSIKERDKGLAIISKFGDYGLDVVLDLLKSDLKVTRSVENSIICVCTNTYLEKSTLINLLTESKDLELDYIDIYPSELGLESLSLLESEYLNIGVTKKQVKEAKMSQVLAEHLFGPYELDQIFSGNEKIIFFSLDNLAKEITDNDKQILTNVYLKIINYVTSTNDQNTYSPVYVPIEYINDEDNRLLVKKLAAQKGIYPHIIGNRASLEETIISNGFQLVLEERGIL